MDLKLKNKKALVFGSSQGLGLAVAKELIAEGAEVVITSRGSEKLATVAKEIGAKTYLECDLYSSQSTIEMVKKAIERLGGIDILITNAGGPPTGNFFQITHEQWEKNFQSLFLSVVDSLQIVLPIMQKQNWGRVVMLTSIAGREAKPNLTISNGLRAGLHGLMKSVSKEVAEFGVTINSVLPSYTETERLIEIGIPLEELINRTPAKRLGVPSELGKLIAFLCSEHAGFITGQSVLYDGGLSQGL